MGAGGGYHKQNIKTQNMLFFIDNILNSDINLAHSKFAKVLPIYSRLKENCFQFGFFHQLLSIDESMVPYRGLHSARQYIKGKPVKFGYKIWMLCSSDGFPYNFDIYCGKESRREGPLGSHVVNTLLAPVSNKNQHIVFFDNFS